MDEFMFRFTGRLVAGLAWTAEGFGEEFGEVYWVQEKVFEWRLSHMTLTQGWFSSFVHFVVLLWHQSTPPVFFSGACLCLYLLGRVIIF